MKAILVKLSVSFLFALACAPSQAQNKECAMVLIHGKWGNTQYISFFGRRMEPTCDYKAIEMPWSQRRNYDQPYLVAISEIADQVQKFRSQGYKRVVLAGHSFGANAALAYLVVRDDVDALILLAPGHTPRSMHQKRGMNHEALQKAKDLIAANKGEEKLSFEDFNQGTSRSMRISANSLISYFDPDGLGDMPTSAKSFKKSIPLILVVGTRDRYFPYAESEIYSNVPSNSHSKYLIVDADHGSTPDVAALQVVEWLKRLP